MTINRVVTASGQLEDIINRAFPKAAYKPLAIKIIYALSVHRLTTNGLDVHFGLTAENLKDDLCLFLPMPEQDADFLLALIKTTLKDIMTTVSGQFIIYNDANNQYYIDVDKIVDYDEKIKQKASIMADGELNRYFYQLIYSCLDWDAKQYVPGFEIYQRDLNWDSHNIFREGYLFLGLPGERSTAQPERDFYIHIMPPYSSGSIAVKNLEDEVYFFFKSTAEFKEILGFFSAANAQAQISEGKDKDAYLSKAVMIRKKLIKYLSENKNTCFDVQYKGQKRQIIEVLRGRYNRDMDFKDTVDLAASLCLDEYFCGKYPDCPVMKTKVTRKNMAENARQAFDYFAGRKTQIATLMLQSFGVLDGDKIRPEGSKYAAYYIDQLKQLPPQGVINYSDIFDVKYDDQYEDKHFKINYLFTPIIFLSMVYAGYATITLRNGTALSASNLDTVPRISVLDLYEFKYLARPAQMAMAELKKLFDVLEINPALLDNPNDRDEGVKQLLKKAQETSNAAVLANQKLNNGFELWNEPLVDAQHLIAMQKACAAVKDEFSNYSARFNTPAKLNNFTLTFDEIDKLVEQIALIKAIAEYVTFKTDCANNVSYLSNIEFIDLGANFKQKLEAAKEEFRSARDSILTGTSGDAAAQRTNGALEKIKDVIREEKDLTKLVGTESNFDVDSALRTMLTYYECWQGHDPRLIDRISIADEEITQHLKTELVQDRTAPLMSIQIDNFPNEEGYFMLWELSISEKESGKRILPIFVNSAMVLRPMAGKRIMDVFLDGSSKLRVSSVPNVDAEIYSKLEKICMDFAYDTFVELKEKQMQQNEESFKKYMYALELRQEAAEHIGIENIRRSRLQKLQKEKANIEAQHRKGSQVYPDFRLIMMARLEA